MIYCSVYGCYSNDTFGSRPSQVFYKIPKKPIERSRKWKTFCADPNLLKHSGKKRKCVCDLHFLSSDFMFINGKQYLKGDAVPSVNVSKDGSMQNIVAIGETSSADRFKYYPPIPPVSTKKDLELKTESHASVCTAMFVTDGAVEGLDAMQEVVLGNDEISCETLEVKDQTIVGTFGLLNSSVGADVAKKRNLSITKRNNPFESETDLSNLSWKKRRFKSGKVHKKRKLFGVPLSSLDQNTTECSLSTDSNSQTGDVLKAEWHGLFNPRSLTFPQLPESYISPMVNQMREKLNSLSERDQLEVRFLLSLFSCYPEAPPNIRKLMLERLNLVYIATMFQWDTAIGLIPKAELNDVTVSNLKPASADSNYAGIQCSSPVYDGDKAKEGEAQDNPRNLPKLPDFPFEVIINDECSRRIKIKKYGSTISLFG